MVFNNLSAIADAAGTHLISTIRIKVFWADISDFTAVNRIYSHYFSQPFPARSAFQVAALPFGANLEVEAIIHLSV